MKRLVYAAVAGVWLVVASVDYAWATPSSTFWTPCTIDMQPAGVTHLGIDNYWSGTSGAGPSFPTDLGLTWGVNLGPKLAAEYGLDAVVPSDHPWFFNAKLGYRENTLSPTAPALQLGFFNFGTESEETDQNIVYLLTGKTLPNGKTRVAAAYYLGNDRTLRSSTGEGENQGVMAAVDYQLVPGRVVLAADYASGKNAIGGGGLGVYYYFTKDSSLLVGPVWFSDRGLNGGMKWTAQWDINF
jgi:hypothetical protein